MIPKTVFPFSPSFHIKAANYLLTSAYQSLAATATGTSVSNAGNVLYIGNNAAHNRAMDGFISEVFFWRRILSQNEITVTMKNLGSIYGVTIS